VNPVRHLQETTSTNDEARKWARRGAPDGATVVADHQTAGRGRLGRTWHSPPGINLYLSQIHRGPFEKPSLLPLLGALATREAVQKHLPSDLTAAIKWPNDILVGEYKIAGILSELSADVVIIGIGINVNMQATDFQGDLRHPATSLRMLFGNRQDRDAVLNTILDRLRHWHEQYRKNTNQLTDTFGRHCITLGRKVTISLPDREPLAGTAVRLNTRGALIVEGPDGDTHCIEAGDVEFQPQ
jgi:BirA family biotin operon repressor/biotin-[acetyl-CoA-carboxylase] ligase